MVKIEIAEGYGKVEVSGKHEEVLNETGFALYYCVKIMRECGKSNDFIMKMFKIALSDAGDEKDE